MLVLDIPAALREVKSKTEAVIEQETAMKWASRSVACYRLWATTFEDSWLERAKGYAQEALEHASLYEHERDTLAAPFSDLIALSKLLEREHKAAAKIVNDWRTTAQGSSPKPTEAKGNKGKARPQK